MINTVEPSNETAEINQKIIKQMEGFGIDISKAKGSLDCNLRNSVTTLYFLLCKKNNNIIPRPPTTLSSQNIQRIQRIQRMHGIKFIETKKPQRPISRIKIMASSVSPKAPVESRSTTRASSRIRKFIVPKEPENKPKTPTRRAYRNYKPAQSRQKLNSSYKTTPKNLEISYRINYPTSLFSP